MEYILDLLRLVDNQQLYHYWSFIPSPKTDIEY